MSDRFRAEVAFAVATADAWQILDRHVFQAPRDEDGVTRWRGLVLAVLNGTQEQVREAAGLLLRGERPGGPAGQRRFGRLLGAAEGDVRLRIACGEEHAVGAGAVVLPLRREVRLSRFDAGHVRVALSIGDAEALRNQALALLLCALHHEWGGFSGFWADGEEALPNAALAALCLRPEGYDDLAQQAWQRHLRDSAAG